MEAKEIETKLIEGNKLWADFVELHKNLGDLFEMIGKVKGNENVSDIPAPRMSGFFDEKIKAYSYLLTDESKAVGFDYFQAFLETKKLAKLL